MKLKSPEVVEDRIDPRKERRVSREPTKRVLDGESALAGVLGLQICKTSEVKKYLGLKIPNRFLPLKDEASDWVGFSDFQDSKVREKIEKELDDCKPGLYTVVSETDLNNFKGFNDPFGLAVGDGVIANSSIVYATLLEQKIKDIPNVDIYRGPGDEVITIGQNLTKKQAMRLASAIKEASDEIHYSGKKDKQQEIPYNVTCTAFTEVVANVTLKNGVSLMKMWKIKGEEAKRVYDVNSGLGYKISNLEIVFGLMEESKGTSKADALVRDFNNFKNGNEGIPSKLVHFEKYLETQARQSNWMRDIYVIFQDVRGKLENAINHPTVQIGVKTGNLEEIVALYMLDNNHNKRMIARLAEAGVIDMGKVNDYLKIDIVKENISILTKEDIDRYTVKSFGLFFQLRRDRGMIRI